MTTSLPLNDGNRIPHLGLGVYQIPSATIVPTVLHALEAGYRHIDTAADYGNEQGVGRAISQSALPRNELFITTKVRNADQARTRPALDASLERLGLDYVDLYLIHWPTPMRTTRFAAWEAMREAQADGLIRSIGVSNFLPHHLAELIERSSTIPVVNQIELHPTYQQHDVQAANNKHGVLTEAYTPLGLGDDLRHPTIVDIAKRIGRTPAQVVLRWHTQAGRVSIPKSVTPTRITENAAIFDFHLSPEDITAIDDLEAGNLLGWNPETVQ